MGEARTRRPRLPRTLKVTREGRWYIGVTLGVGFAAANTGNNLLFLSLGMLLSLIILSGILSEAALKRVWLERVLPRELRAGEPALFELVVENHNRIFPSVGLTFTELALEGAEASPGRCVNVPAGEGERARLRITPSARGQLELVEVRVTTAYPFGIFEKSRRIALPASLLVWPGRTTGQTAPDGTDVGQRGEARRRRGFGEDLRGLRPWRQGDEARQIHWRRSLRVGELLVIERESPTGRRVSVRLAPGSGDAFEAAVRVAAAEVDHHLREGDEVALLTSEQHIPHGAGSAHRRRLLDHLALVAPSEGAKEAA